MEQPLCVTFLFQQILKKLNQHRFPAILYDNIGDSVTIGLTDHEWDFFAKIDDDVYEVDASITLNPTTEAIPKLILCFSETCSAQSSATTMMTLSALTMSSYCDCETSALTMEEFSY